MLSGNFKFSTAVLPDFRWYSIPKWEKYTKQLQNKTNGNNTYKITTKYIEWP
jgi:hypothetical protein